MSPFRAQFVHCDQGRESYARALRPALPRICPPKKKKLAKNLSAAKAAFYWGMPVVRVRCFRGLCGDSGSFTGASVHA